MPLGKPNNAKPLIVYLIAGEASGDALGAGLMRELKEQTGGHVMFYGIGGERMREEGLSSLFPYFDLALMGFAEILPHAIKLMGRINLTVEDIIQKQPDVVVTIDSPGFNFRVARKLRSRDRALPKLIHYVAPTVWAYKPHRAAVTAQLFDHLLTLLPFEAPYFTAHGLGTTYIGHAVAWQPPPGNPERLRAKYGIPASTELLVLLPGSRTGEIARHMPYFARAVALLAESIPDFAMIVPVAPHLMPMVGAYFQGCPFRAVLTADEQDKRDAFTAARAGLVKSGTITLEAATAGLPMVVAYRANPISVWMIRRMLLTPYVNLINVLQGREAIPEMLQEHVDPRLLADAVQALWRSEEARTAQRQAMRLALTQLQPPEPLSPHVLAARTVLQLLH